MRYVELNHPITLNSTTFGLVANAIKRDGTLS